MKLDEKRLRYPHEESEDIITDKDFNPNYDLRVDLTSHVGKKGEMIELPPKNVKVPWFWLILSVIVLSLLVSVLFVLFLSATRLA